MAPQRLSPVANTFQKPLCIAPKNDQLSISAKEWKAYHGK